MPLERHRQRAPLGPRQRRAVAALLGLLAVAAVVIAVVAANGSRGTAGRCIDVTVPSTTGAASIHACGDAARQFCAGRQAVPADVVAQVRAACRRLRPGA